MAETLVINPAKNPFSSRVEFSVSGRYALFSDPVTRIGGEKTTYLIPTYEALKGILKSIYWKPTIIWYIDRVRVMNPIKTETKGIRTILYDGSKPADLSCYTYLKDVNYHVQAHFEWNFNQAALKSDRDQEKHLDIAKRMIGKGGRYAPFLGTSECQALVEPCAFMSGDGYYDQTDEMDFGMMYHGITYADEAYSKETKGCMTTNLWHPVMKHGIITFCRPEECPVHKVNRAMSMKEYGVGENLKSIDDTYAEYQSIGNAEGSQAGEGAAV